MNSSTIRGFCLGLLFCSGLHAQLKLDRQGHIPGVRKFQRIAVDARALIDAGRTGNSVPFILAGQRHQLKLSLHDMRTGDYKLLQISPDGDHELSPRPVATYKGELDGDPTSQVRFTILENKLRGYVRFGTSWIFIEPLEPDSANPQMIEHVAYSAADADSLPGAANDVILTHRAIASLQASPSSSPLTATIILDGDAEYYNLNPAAWMSAQESVLNQVEGIYSSEVQVSFQLRLQAIHTSPTDFTGTSVCQGSPQDLTSQVNAYWGARTEGRDLVHVFSGKSFDGVVIGCAYQPGLGINSESAGITQHVAKGSSYTATALQQTLVVAHEMGHTFNGAHASASETYDSACNCYDDTIMSATFYGTAPTPGGHQIVSHFSDANKQRITAEAQQVLCATGAASGLTGPELNIFIDDYYRNGARLPVGCATDNTSAWSNGVVQHFAGGTLGSGAIVLGNALQSAGWLYGAVWNYYAANNGPLLTFADGSHLGYPTQDLKAGPNSSVSGSPTLYGAMENGQIQSYASGPRFGQTYVVRGVILARWGTAGGPLGMPVTEEAASQSSPFGTAGRVQNFENGQIYWLSSGAHAGAGFFVEGAISNKYSSVGGSGGALGFPVSDEYAFSGGVRNDFEGGYIYTSGSNAIVVLPVPETVPKPLIPVGPSSGFPSTSYAFSATGSVSSKGNPARYRFFWGDGTDSGWLGLGITSAVKTWTASGAFNVTAQAGLADLSILSPLSDALPVTIAAPPLAAPVLSSPADGAAGVSVTASLAWNPVSGSAAYSVYLGTTNPPPLLGPAVSSTYTPSLSPGLTYYWTIASRDPNNGNAEAKAAIRSFTTVNASVNVGFSSNPAGISIIIDGGAPRNAPFTLSLAPGPHTVSAPGSLSSSGTQNTFSSWSDGGAQSHSVTINPGQAVNFSVSYTTQYQLTMSSSPSAVGTVTPGSGSFYNAGATVAISAGPASGFVFSNWLGNVASASSASTTVLMNAPQAVTANFSSLTGITFQTNPPGLPVTVDGSTQMAPFSLALAPGQHAVSLASSLTSGGVQNVFSSWSDGGGQSHSISINAGQPATFTANYSTRYQLNLSASPSNGGSVSPASGTYYGAGSVVSVSASAGSGFVFSGWSGSVASAASGSTSILMNAPQAITANFIAAAITVSSSIFVRQLYRDLLDREPDPGGFSFWVSQLDSGALTRSQVGAHFFTSNEFVSGGLYIVKLYLAVLGRDPDFQGWSFWFDSWHSGIPPASILNAFLMSPEFTGKFGNLSDYAFMTLVYQSVLGRDPDSGGLQFYLGLLAGNRLTRAQVFDQFVQSPEYAAKVSARAYANLLYMGFLRRSADSGGLSFWTNTLASNPLETAVNGFITSPEYLQRLAQIAP